MPLLLAACAPGQLAEPATVGFSPPDSARCVSASFAIDTDFPAGALESCEIDESGAATIVIAPEDDPPINCSAWYAFRVTPAAAAELNVKLTYTDCGHRYWPKISYDGSSWEYLRQDQVEVDEFAGRKFARLALENDGRPFYVSAQEIIVPATYDAWLDRIEGKAGSNRYLLGRSAEGRAIEAISIGSSDARENVVLVGRQHPPEVTGALAMFPFVETLLGDDDLAARFRERFHVTAVPLLNPDGVVRGHWRHNTGGVDLNRDWGKFSQPETRLMGDRLAELSADPARELVLFVDFHSTQRDVVYTLSPELETDPPGYLDAWLADYQARLPGYEVSEEPGYSAGRGVSKNWVYEAYGVPTATYEIGDETDRALIEKISKAAARAMMKTLLETPAE